MIVSVVYDDVRIPVIRYGRCPGCGKRVKRQTTFVETISPFNRNEFGIPKSYQEVFESVAAKAKAWGPDEWIFEHEKCRKERLENVGTDLEP